VAVRGPDGSVYDVPAAELSQLPEGADLASPEEVRHAELQAKYGTTGGELKSFGLGAARGLSFGLSDAAIGGIGGAEARRELANYEEANPTASLGGEIAGAAAPLLFSGGASAPESLAARGVRAAGALPRGVAALGGAVERGAARVLGEGATSIAGRVAQRAIPSALGAAAEGAAYGIGHEISESAIQNHELTAEKLLAGAGRGAIFGAALGGGFSAAGSLAGEGARALGGAVARRMEGSSLASWLDRKAGEEAFTAAGGGARVARRAEDFAEGGFAGVGKIWREEAPKLAGKRSFSTLTREDLGTAAAKGLEREGTTLGEVIGATDTAAGAAGKLPKALDVVGDIENVAAKLSARAGNGAAVSKLQGFADDVKRLTGLLDGQGNMAADAADRTITFQQLRDFRVDADKMWKGAKAAPDLVGTAKHFGDVRNALEGRLTRGIGESLGAKELARYAAAKQKAQAFYLLQDATKNAAASAGSNQSIGLTDKIVGGAGAVAGSVIGGPLGAAAGAAIGGTLNKAIRAREHFIAADVLSHAANLAGIQRAAAQIDARMSSGVRAFLEGGKRAGRAAAGETNARRTEKLRRRAEDIAAIASDPVRLQQHIERHVGGLGNVAPNISTQAAVKLAASYQYLAAQAPRARTNATSLTPRAEVERIGDTELRAFAKKLEAVEDPLSILDDMAKGKLSHDKVRAVRDNAPELFSEIRDELISQATRKKGKLSWEQRKQAAVLFDAPTDDALSEDFVAAMQISAEANYGAPSTQASAQQRQQGGGRRPIDIDTGALQTSAQESEAP
jgi:hypothetical protein